uniref:Uncharacterized protein n=1 Tax=Tanacetum cinerariifolium TaxID=118510 RepID=A0A699L3D8_TANCI|nr:hypothetical protein [Tanacetum cinerariifolium]
MLVLWKLQSISDSLLLTPLSCDDHHDVTPRVSTLAGCDNPVGKATIVVSTTGAENEITGTIAEVSKAW